MRFGGCSEMRTFKKEIETILFALRGSPWATHPQVQKVISEYEHFIGASRTQTQSRRVSLQIFHSSRAIDSLLKHMVEHEGHRVGRPVAGYLTLQRSLNNIQHHGVGGQRFTAPTETDVKDLTRARNQYLHVAADFPTDGDLQVFLNQTVRAIGEASSFPP